MSLDDRISNLEIWGSNCMGTALYVAGMKDTDKYTTYDEFDEAITDLSKTETPKVGDLVVKRQKRIKPFGHSNAFHAGVVYELPNNLLFEWLITSILRVKKRMTVYDRNGASGKLRFTNEREWKPEFSSTVTVFYNVPD